MRALLYIPTAKICYFRLYSEVLCDVDWYIKNAIKINSSNSFYRNPKELVETIKSNPDRFFAFIERNELPYDLLTCEFEIVEFDE